MSAPFQVGNTLESASGHAIRRAAGWLACLQARDGHWCAELTADTTLESDYILFQLWLEPPVNGVWSPASRPLIEKAARCDSGPPVARWRIQYLRRRSERSERQR